MEVSPGEIAASMFTRLMVSTVVPRPIAWVSTVNAEGRPNLAPFSFFNLVCYTPPTLLFCPEIRGTDGGVKDTLKNIRATGEFVVNIVTEATAEAMNLTATELPPEVNEFEHAGLAAAPAHKVRPLRVAQSPVSYECRLTQIVDIGNGARGSGSIVIGEIVHLYVADEILLPEYKIDMAAFKPVGRLAGYGYNRVSDTFEMRRPPSQITPEAK
ncbi:MAG: flavin reductase family protein [Anaerolineales bacterium]|nr:flavin reductase family protein [Anaerolineales bacterium]MCW5854651.1 flavin reductase family protein [Anaerolineales bacterium]